MSEHDRILALTRLRRWLAAWSSEQLRLMAIDDGLSELLREACGQEIEARIVSAMVLP